MAGALNPYSPPTSSLERESQLGKVVCDGRLVRLDRHGRLPDRCIICNEPGERRRVTRATSHSPLAWRLAAFGIPLTLLTSGVFTQSRALALFFWPAVLLLSLIHVFVRQRVKVDYSLCAAHRRLHLGLFAASILSLLAVLALFAELIRTGTAHISLMLFGMIPVMLLVETVRRHLGPNRVRAASVDERHMWLRGAGKAFRQSLR